jgi:hypothetical protein
VSREKTEPESEPASRGWKRPLLIVLATAPVGVAVFAFAFMVHSEVAFDEDRCPYRTREERSVGDAVSVREEARACSDGVEEHRWVLLRDGDAPLELGRRRLVAELYQGYTWEAREENGRVRIEIRNPGQDPRVFREPGPDAAR